MKYINTAIRIAGLIVGGIVFGITTMIFYMGEMQKPWAWGMIMGACAAAVIAILFAYMNYREYKKFESAASRVEGEIIGFSVATLKNFDRGRRVYVFLTADTIRIFMWDKRPYMESTLSKGEVRIAYHPTQPHYLGIIVEDDERMDFVLPHATELVKTMREHFYSVEEMRYV